MNIGYALVFNLTDSFAYALLWRHEYRGDKQGDRSGQAACRHCGGMLPDEVTDAAVRLSSHACTLLSNSCGGMLVPMISDDTRLIHSSSPTIRTSNEAYKQTRIRTRQYARNKVAHARLCPVMLSGLIFCMNRPMVAPTTTEVNSDYGGGKFVLTSSAEQKDCCSALLTYISFVGSQMTARSIRIMWIH